MGVEKGILLVYPPVAKACEPPGGSARLAGALRRQGIFCPVWDANLEGQLHLLAISSCMRGGDSDAWTRRAARGLSKNLGSLRSLSIYGNTDRYSRAAADLNRLLIMAARPYGVRLSLVDYEDNHLSANRSSDLLHAAEAPETNPFYSWFRDRLPEVIDGNPVSHIGFSLNYLSQALTTFSMIGFLRYTHPALQIVLGGGLVTSWMRSPGWRNPFAGLVDEMIAGPGEEPLLALFGKESTDEHGSPDLDGLPLSDYLAPGIVLPYSASSGCWWRRCSFCPERAEGTPYRSVSVRRVTSDLRFLTTTMKPLLIHLLDNALSPALLEGLAAAPPGANWYGFSRVIPQLADRDFCKRLRESGCVMLQLGLESGDQAVLDSLNKGVLLSTAEAVLKNLRAVGIAVYLYLLFGTPAETSEAARKTMDFTVAHADEISFLNLALFNLPAYGPETGALETGEFYAGDLSFYRPFVHPSGWQRAEVRRFLDKEFRKHPALSTLLRRDPPFFTSNHAPFVAMDSSTK
jgi:hypothetical protein